MALLFLPSPLAILIIVPRNSALPSADILSSINGVNQPCSSLKTSQWLHIITKRCPWSFTPTHIPSKYSPHGAHFFLGRMWQNCPCLFGHNSPDFLAKRSVPRLWQWIEIGPGQWLPTIFFKKDCFFRAVLGSKQNWRESTELSYIPLLPTPPHTHTVSPVIQHLPHLRPSPEFVEQVFWALKHTWKTHCVL